MKKYFELKNRESEFVGAVLIFDGSEQDYEEAREIFLSSIEENNWYEDQTLSNAISILRQTAIECEREEYLSIGLIEDGKEEISKFLRKNIYKQVQEDDAAIITTDVEKSKEWTKGCEIVCSEACEEIGEQY